MATTQGWKTSEFLTVIIGAILTYVWTALKLPEDALKWILGVIATYIASRTVIKATNDADGK